MKAEVIKSKDVEEKTFGVLKAKQYFNTSKLENMSMAIITLNGENKPAKNEAFDSMYFVLEGDGVFTLDGRKFHVEAGDLVVIPRGVAYQDRGKLRLLCFNSPRWTSENN